MSALSQKKKLVRQQAILIQHALMCTDHCTLPFCEDMKAALTHMAKCQPGIQCPVKHCASSWAIYTHAKNCKKPVCAVCEPFSSRINDSKIENVTERSIELWMEVVGMRAQSLNASTVERAVNTTMDVSVLEASVIDLPVTQTTNTMKENEEPTAMTVLNAKSDGQRAMEAQTAHNGENSTEKSTQGSTNEMFSGQPEESLTGKGPTRRKSSSGRLSLQKSTKSKTTEKKPTEKKSIETKTAEKNVVEKKPTKKRTSEKKAAEKKPTKRRSSVVSTQADSTKEKSTENNSAAMEPTTEPTEEESTNNISLDMPTIEEEPTTLFFTTAMEANSILGGALNTTEMNMTASNASFSQTNLVQSTPMVRQFKKHMLRLVLFIRSMLI